ncbi:ligand-binding sensor domain-containing protein, partial [Dokdonella sp.]|uniref:ligand-binding sensor domain-containing protein n=1 Tax=Dokdonella sp. TaxID=2291710 RepID=UPI003C688AD3
MSQTLPAPGRHSLWRNPARWLLTTVLLLGSFSTSALEREFYFDRIDNESGLLQNSIRSLLQTDDGRIWIGTQGGLHKFDGYRFKIYEHDADDPASLPDSAVTALADGEGNQIWVGTSANGVARLDPVSGKFEPFTLPLDATARNARDAITDLRFDGGRGLWVGSRGGLGLLDPKTRERKPFTARDSEDSIGVVKSLLLNADRTMWAATSSGLWRVVRGSNFAERVAADSLEQASSVFEGEDHTLYVGNATGLHRIDPAIGKSTLVWSSGGQGPVNAIVEDSTGQLWLAVGGQGLLIFDRHQDTTRWVRPDSDVRGNLPQAAITLLMVDRSGLLWVGTDAAGLSKLDPAGAAFTYIADRDRDRELSVTNNIRSILEDRAGAIWLGTDGDGLKRFDRATSEFTHFDAVIAEAFEVTYPSVLQIESLAEDADGLIWFASNLGIGSIDPASGEVRALEPSPMEIADGRELQRRVLIITRDGRIWYAGRSVGVVRYDPATGEWRNWKHHEDEPNSLTHDHILSLYEDTSGRVWAGSADGLNLIDPDSDDVRTFRHEGGNPTSLSSGVVRAIHESADGGMWIGTHGGLNHLASVDDGPARFERVLKRDGLPDATIYGILEDVMGRLWLSTNRGIVSFNPLSRAIHQFSVKDGLQGQEFNGAAYATLGSGELAFGGINGLNLVKPGAVVGSRFLAPVIFSDIRIGEEKPVVVVPGKAIEMDQANRVVHFAFAALDYTAPERNRFRYKLEGFDENWVEAGTRHEATYTNLDPGQYRFKVQASNHDGYWNQAGAEINLIVRPQWWNSPNMLLGYAFLAILALLGLALAIRRKREEQRRHARELRDREARLRLALWGSSDEFWELNMDSGVLTRLSAAPTPARQ